MNTGTKNSFGRIDVHSHILPGIDDGSRSIAESVSLALAMSKAGYTHMFCTPHYWPGMEVITPDFLQARVRALQAELDQNEVPLTLLPGSELNLSLDISKMSINDIPTFGLAGRHVLFDFWDDKLPRMFWPWVKRLQSMGLTVILAHPERNDCIQNDPTLIDTFDRGGLLLQGNLHCLADAPGRMTRELAEKWLKTDRYFMLGSDLHRTEGVAQRLDGLSRAIELVGEERVWKLTHTNPKSLLTNTDPDKLPRTTPGGVTP